MGPRDRALRAACRVARVGLDYVFENREAIEHGVQVVEWFVAGRADLAGVEGSLAGLRALSSRAHQSEDRASWHAVEAVVSLSAMVLTPMEDVAAKRAYRVAAATLDAMAHPNGDDEALRIADDALRATLIEVCGPESRRYVPKTS